MIPPTYVRSSHPTRQQCLWQCAVHTFNLQKACRCFVCCMLHQLHVMLQPSPSSCCTLTAGPEAWVFVMVSLLVAIDCVLSARAHQHLIIVQASSS